MSIIITSDRPIVDDPTAARRPADLADTAESGHGADLADLADLADPEDLADLLDPADGRARCADGNGTLTPLFFSDHVIDIARAKAICAKCTLRERCLAGALARAEPWGVWGGELLSQGRIVAVKRPCGRPPTRPRPELVVDEMGVVGTREPADAVVA